MKIHHVGYLVKSIQSSIKEFEKLGYIQEQDTIFDKVRNIYICFMVQDDFRIELVEAANEQSVVFQLAKKFRNSPYHICYESSNFDQDVSQLRENGYVIMQSAEPACALGDRKVVFFMNSDIGIVEVLESDEFI